MNAVTNVWNQIFNRSETDNKGEVGSPSPAQCEAGFAVFGADDPNIKAQCDRYRTQIKSLAQKQADEIVTLLKDAVSELSEQILELDGRVAAAESDGWEKRYLTPRMSAAMFADDPAGSLSQIGRKEKSDRPAGSASWIDAAQHFAGQAAERRRQDTKNQPLNQKLPPGLYRKKYSFE